MEAPDTEMETAVGTGGAGYSPEHFTGAAGTTTENGLHPRREYNKVVSEVSVGGQASAGPAAVEGGLGTTTHSAGDQQAKGGDKNPWRAS